MPAEWLEPVRVLGMGLQRTSFHYPRSRRRFLAVVAVLVLVAACSQKTAPAAEPATATPIKHLVVIYQENISFDHYFGTYPHAANTDGQPFTAKPDTPAIDGLTPDLLTHNPNQHQPKRLGGPGQQLTCDQHHEYQREQLSVQRRCDGSVPKR